MKPPSPRTDFPSVIELVQSAWSKVSGAKKPFVLAGLTVFAASLLIQMLRNLLTSGSEDLLNYPITLLNFVLSGVLSAGLFHMGIRRARGEQVNPTMVLEHKDEWFNLGLVVLLTSVLTGIGFFLLIAPGIYLAVSYTMSLPIAALQKKGAWEALESSRKAVTTHWFTVGGCCLVLIGAMIASLATLFIGFIWAVPFASILFGEIYLALEGTVGPRQTRVDEMVDEARRPDTQSEVVR